MTDHLEVEEPEFEYADDRPAWWHRQQWLSSQPSKPRKGSKPKYAFEDPRRVGGDSSDPLPFDLDCPRFPPLPAERQREIEAALAAGRNPWGGRALAVRAVPQPARTSLSVPRPRKWSAKTGNPHTYLIKADGSHLVKIGISTDPERRLKFLQTGQPMDLYLMWSVPGDYEYDLHIRFAEYRYRGEWFDLRELGDPVTVVTDAINEIRAAKTRT